MTANTFFDDDGTEQAVGLVAPLTDRVNSEPAILKGLTATETVIAMAVFFPAWIFLGAVVSWLVGRWQVVMLVGVIGPLASVWFGAGFLAAKKRNRPDHYYLHAFGWWRHRFGLGAIPFISLRGAWDLGRSMSEIARPRTSWVSRIATALCL